MIVIDYHNICYGCMEARGAQNTCPACGFPAGSGPESALHLPPGTVLQDKYMIGRALGQGGFGITYLAWDKTLKIKLAIKEYLPQQLAYRTGVDTTVNVYKSSLVAEFSYGREKFLEEAQTLARFIEHPNIVSVRDYFEANGTAYLVMNYHEGVTLQAHLQSRGGRIGAAQAVSIFMPVLDALKEVHTEGILHRDISPDNLLIDKNGRVILIDFGAARQAVGEKSRSLSVIMKAGYSPPEQYQSRGKQGPWTDIYAVAATMYRAVTGQAPLEAIDRMANDDLAAPSQLGEDIDARVEQALLKALAVKAEDRFQAVEDFQTKLMVLPPDALEEESTAAQSQPARQSPLVKFKKCPYCSEDIKADDVLCSYCRMRLDEVKPEVMENTDGNWIKRMIAFGLPIGIMMSIIFSMQSGSLAIGLLWGILSGALFGLLCTWCMRWFVQRTTSRFQANRPDFSSEAVLIEGPANYGKGLKAAAGYLWITDRRVHFAFHSFNKQNHCWTVLLLEIRDVQGVKTFGLFDEGFSIRTDTAENHRFVVNNSRRWVVVIHHLITADQSISHADRTRIEIDTTDAELQNALLRPDEKGKVSEDNSGERNNLKNAHINRKDDKSRTEARQHKRSILQKKGVATEKNIKKDGLSSNCKLRAIAYFVFRVFKLTILTVILFVIIMGAYIFLNINFGLRL